MNPQTPRSPAAAFLLASIAVTVLLYAVPYGRTVAYPLMLISSLAHELGHGIAGLLAGGTFESLAIFSDGSGVARVGGNGGRFARALVAAGGLCGPAIAAAFGFILARRPAQARLALGGVALLLGLACVLVVRNLFGLVFVGALAAGLGLVALRASAWASQLTLLFLSVQLALSVFSRSDYLFTRYADTGGGRMPSDVANMASALFLPYWFWGALCAALSLGVVGIGALAFLRGLARDTPRPAALR